MSTVRVAYFMSEFPRRTDTFVQREVQALRGLGAEVDTYSLRRPGEDVMVGPEQVEHRAATTYVLEAGLGGVANALVSQLAHPRRFAGALRLAAGLARPGVRGAVYQTFYVAEALLLAAKLRRAGHEHLHAHYGDVSSTIALIAARMAGVRFSFTLHGPGVFFEAHSWHLGRKIDEADFVACISWFCRSQAQLLGSPGSADHLHVIHCGIEPDRYLPTRGDSPRYDRPFCVGTVGRLEHVKGSSVLLEAFAALRERIPGATLSFVGDGPDREALVADAARRGLADSVTFHGARSQQEVAELLATFDVFALPSFAEGVPVVLMEAQASGVPVVATQVGGVSELVVDGQTGLIVPPGDVDAFTDAMVSLAVDPARRHVMGVAGASRVQGDFSSVIEAARLLALFSDVKEGSPSAIRPIPLPGRRP